MLNSIFDYIFSSISSPDSECVNCGYETLFNNEQYKSLKQTHYSDKITVQEKVASGIGGLTTVGKLCDYLEELYNTNKIVNYQSISTEYYIKIIQIIKNHLT